MSRTLHVIITGGIGAGKTNLINKLCETGNYIIGSPATTMKDKLAHMIARTINTDGSDEGWVHYFNAMMDRREKEKYRGILQGYGEHFSNLDQFFWIRRTMEQVSQAVDALRWSNNFDFVNGTVYDSIRRPQEIIGIREVYPDAIRVHLVVSRERQIDYLVNHLQYEYEKAISTLGHSSEHWLDNNDAKDTQADFVIDADLGDDYVWRTFKRGLNIGDD